MEPLNDKLKSVLEFIEEEVARNNYPPSVREICKALGIPSTATVYNHLLALEKLGYISRKATQPRAIHLIRDHAGDFEKRCVYVPMVGRITAGKPILADENRESYFPLPVQVSAGDNCFVLQIVGESMNGAGIFDKDYVIVRQQNTAENGEIVAVLLGEEATVKRFYRENGGVRLQPENDAFEPILTKEAVILGKLVGLFRKI